MNELSTRKRLDILAIAAECLHACGCGDEQIADTLSLDRAAIPLLLDRLRSLRGSPVGQAAAHRPSELTEEMGGLRAG